MEEKIKNVFAIVGVILGIAFCIFLLNVVESRENEKQNEPEITENFLKKFFKALINLIKNWLNS